MVKSDDKGCVQRTQRDPGPVVGMGWAGKDIPVGGEYDWGGGCLGQGGLPAEGTV